MQLSQDASKQQTFRDRSLRPVQDVNHRLVKNYMPQSQTKNDALNKPALPLNIKQLHIAYYRQFTINRKRTFGSQLRWNKASPHINSKQQRYSLQYAKIHDLLKTFSEAISITLHNISGLKQNFSSTDIEKSIFFRNGNNYLEDSYENYRHVTKSIFILKPLRKEGSKVKNDSNLFIIANKLIFSLKQQRQAVMKFLKYLLLLKARSQIQLSKKLYLS